MIGLAGWLLLVAIADAVRGGRDAGRPRLLGALAGCGALLSVLMALALRPSASGWAAWVVASISIAGWILGSGVAAARFRKVSVPGLPVQITGPVAAGVAYGCFAVGLLGLLLAGSSAGSAPVLMGTLAKSGLGRFPGEWVLLVSALLVVQISTANVIVRLLLDLVGVPASDNEKTLRGGRVLGPMERLIILGLGVGGGLLGAAVVVAAKALLRFPELRVPRAGEPGYGGASDVTEYFLVGSFASWLVALAGVGLVALAAG